MFLTKDIVNNAQDVSRSTIKKISMHEDWVIDDDETINRIKELASEIECIDSSNSNVNVKQEDFIRVLAYLHTSEFLNVLKIIEDNNPSALEALLSTVNNLRNGRNSPFANKFYDRITALHAINTIPRIFSPERIEKLSDTIKEINRF